MGWPVSGFQQLQANHKIYPPKVTEEQIKEYFIYRLAGDRQAASDIKALVKGQLLLQGKRILACSVLVKDSVFFSGIVGAAMKKKVSYNFKIRVHKTSGDPVNTHCECPAGRGPNDTCKHIAAVLLMLKEFTNEGQRNVKPTCTDKLQNFHKPRKTYTGNPVKSEDRSVKRKRLDNFMEDPRPVKYRHLDGFNDRVRNTLIIFCSKLAFLHLYEKADVQSAAKDHDYFSLPFTEYWADDALKVTETAIKDIERATRGQRICKKMV